MQPIFCYIDYRKFLRDHYEESKATKSYFSHRWFARKAGIKSPVFLKLVMEAKRNLSSPMAEKVADALDFNEKEKLYFASLVRFNQSQTSREKREAYAVLRSLRNAVSEKVLDDDNYDYYNEWYISAIRELVCLGDFGDDWSKLASELNPRISPTEAKRAVMLLLRMGLIEKDKQGKYRQTAKAITSGNEVVSLAVRHLHQKMASLASMALDRFPKDERNATGMTIGISKSCYDLIVAEIEAFHERILSIVDSDMESDRVYQLGIHLFPLSNQVGVQQSKEKDKTDENV